MAVYDDGTKTRRGTACGTSPPRRFARWTAEFQIPLSQMRYGAGREHTFGIMLLRDIYRYSERLSWRCWRSSKVGWGVAVRARERLDDLDRAAPPRGRAVRRDQERHADRE